MNLSAVIYSILIYFYIFSLDEVVLVFFDVLLLSGPLK